MHMMQDQYAKDRYDRKLKIRKQMKRKRLRFVEKSDRNILIENKKKLESDAKLSHYDRFLLHKESLLHVQSIFYRVMERNPHIFKMTTLLNLRKRRIKNVIGCENDLHYPIEYKPEEDEKEIDREEMYTNAKIVSNNL